MIRQWGRGCWRRLRGFVSILTIRKSLAAAVVLYGVFIAATNDTFQVLGIKPIAEWSLGDTRAIDPSISAGVRPTDSQTAPSAVHGDAYAIGTCLTEQGDAAACDRSHWGQVVAVSTSQCTSDEAMAFLGGIPGVDTLNSALKAKSVGKNCVLYGQRQQVSLKGVLKSSRGDALRQCIDSEGAGAGCAGRHAAEVVKTATTTETLQCDAAADRYLGISPGRLTNDVEVRQVNFDGARRCVVQVRGDNDLTASVRRVRTSALPLAPRL